MSTSLVSVLCRWVDLNNTLCYIYYFNYLERLLKIDLEVEIKEGFCLAGKTVAVLVELKKKRIGQF